MQSMQPNEVGTSKRLLRILYADDMRELREVARISLSREGHLIECVADGREALNRVAANPAAYDLVINTAHVSLTEAAELIAARIRARNPVAA